MHHVQAPVSFHIQARDSRDKKLAEGGDYVVVRVIPGSTALAAGAKVSEAIVKDNGDGSYTATYSVEARGDYQVVLHQLVTGNQQEAKHKKLEHPPSSESRRCARIAASRPTCKELHSQGGDARGTVRVIVLHVRFLRLEEQGVFWCEEKGVVCSVQHGGYESF